MPGSNIDRDFYQELLENGHLEIEEDDEEDIEDAFEDLEDLLDAAHSYREIIMSYEEGVGSHDLEQESRALGEEIGTGARALHELERYAEKYGLEELYDRGETAFIAAVITGEHAHRNASGLRFETPSGYARNTGHHARQFIPENEDDWAEMLSTGE